MICFRWWAVPCGCGMCHKGKSAFEGWSFCWNRTSSWCPATCGLLSFWNDWSSLQCRDGMWCPNHGWRLTCFLFHGRQCPLRYSCINVLFRVTFQGNCIGVAISFPGSCPHFGQLRWLGITRCTKRYQLKQAEFNLFFFHSAKLWKILYFCSINNKIM